MPNPLPGQWQTISNTMILVVILSILAENVKIFG